LIGRLASFSRVNEYGFIETPYRKVFRTMQPDDERLEGRTLRENVVDPKSGEILFRNGEVIESKMLKRIAKIGQPVSIQPFVSDQFDYLSADAEDKYVIAQANAPLTENKEFVRDRVSCRYHSGFIFSTPESVDYMDVAPHQVVGISAALIPFLEHDDANRALMGSNMQAQAVPLIRPEIPLVSTGMEYHAALDSGQVVVADADGEVTSVTRRQPHVSAAQVSAFQSEHLYRPTPCCG
jgi:DNA-directed RNA polymerase subunit beta